MFPFLFWEGRVATGSSDTKLLNEWYKAVFAAGAALGVPAIAAGNNVALLCAIGLLIFGIGELINHPLRSRPVYNESGGLSGIIMGRSWEPVAIGVVTDMLGVGLLLYGIIRLLLAA